MTNENLILVGLLYGKRSSPKIIGMLLMILPSREDIARLLWGDEFFLSCLGPVDVLSKNNISVTTTCIYIGKLSVSMNIETVYIYIYMCVCVYVCKI